MDKKFKHLGMEMTEAEHEKWHNDHPDMTKKEHKNLMKKMGTSKEEDRKWHEQHDKPKGSQKKISGKTVNPFAIGGGFLNYCVKEGWLIQEGKSKGVRYYLTKQGEEELKKFGIKV